MGMVFELSTVQLEFGERFCIVCGDHADVKPRCELEIMQDKIYRYRAGKRPKVDFIVFLRVSCVVCGKSEIRELDSVRRFGKVQ
jgi:hypothetical protein